MYAQLFIQAGSKVIIANIHHLFFIDCSIDLVQQ